MTEATLYGGMDLHKLSPAERAELEEVFGRDGLQRIARRPQGRALVYAPSMEVLRQQGVRDIRAERQWTRQEDARRHRERIELYERTNHHLPAPPGPPEAGARWLSGQHLAHAMRAQDERKAAAIAKGLKARGGKFSDAYTRAVKMPSGDDLVRQR